LAGYGRGWRSQTPPPAFTEDRKPQTPCLQLIRLSYLDALVAIKCLDEGIDVPDTDLAIILASDASERQFAQRRGRVLRASAGKAFATVVDVLVVPPSTESATSVLKNEVRRFIEFAKSARNRMVAVNRLVHKLELYDITHSDLL
jgi:superfamily II DNA or RNA helicase